MQRHFITRTLTLSLLTLVMLFMGANSTVADSERRHAEEGEDSRHSGRGNFGERVAGTYLITFDRDDEDPTFRRLVTLTAHGNWLSVDAHQYSDEFTFTDQQGAWKRSGRREITARVIDFNYSPAGGGPTGVTRIRFVVRFTSNLQEVHGTMFGETFPADENPLDPEGPPLVTFEATFTGQRVTVDD